ncbi:MAG: metallophosphoesterase [Lentisphaeria bacterium]|nr:metallophosphoesterase [Lentisphaeria bacterium]
MILFITDTHCRYDVINRQVEAAESLLNETVSDVIVLGDFGLYEPFLRRFLGRGKPGFSRPVSFIEGNHEDFDHFDRLVRRYRERITHLPRGTVHTKDARAFLALGGAAYMDAHVTPERSVIKPRDIHMCLSHAPDTVDIVLSHDCPDGLGIENRAGFEHYGEPGFVGGKAIADHFHPSHWLFGHHHRCIEKTIGRTTYIGLPQSWEGFAVLSDSGDIRLIGHTIPNPPLPRHPLIQRVFPIKE